MNQLTNVTRTGGSTSSKATNVTVNGQTASRYADLLFAKDGFTLANGSNTFTAIAQSSTGIFNTNSIAVNLPATSAMTFDANGNMTWDGAKAFEYDDENQLVRVTQTNVFKSEFVYDGLGRMRVKREYDWSSGAWVLGTETRFIYDGMLVIQERGANGYPQVSYTRGKDLSGGMQGAGGIGGLLGRTDHTQASVLLKTAFYHADGNGNITALLSTNGLVLAWYQYSPFGTTLAQSGPLADANVYRFSSKAWHERTGLYYYGFRFYSPNLQRWLNADPIQERGGINLYGFVGNEPVASVDPFGWLVFCVYDQGTGILTCTDEDTGKTVVIKAFSGGTPSLKFPLGADPVPLGCYDLLHRGPKDGFRLEGRDEKYGDDDYKGRNELRMHGPGRSTGCVTAREQGPWDALEKLIRDTKTTKEKVDSKSRNPFSQPTETVVKYGDVKVVDTSKMPSPPNSPPPGSVPPNVPAPGQQLPTGPRSQ